MHGYVSVGHPPYGTGIGTAESGEPGASTERPARTRRRATARARTVGQCSAVAKVAEVVRSGGSSQPQSATSARRRDTRQRAEVVARVARGEAGLRWNARWRHQADPGFAYAFACAFALTRGTLQKARADGAAAPSRVAGVSWVWGRQWLKRLSARADYDARTVVMS